MEEIKLEAEEVLEGEGLAPVMFVTGVEVKGTGSETVGLQCPSSRHSHVPHHTGSQRMPPPGEHQWKGQFT